MTKHDLPIEQGVAGDDNKSRVGNNYASNSASTAMNHLLLGKKPLVNKKPRKGPHPGAIPPGVRKSSTSIGVQPPTPKSLSESAEILIKMDETLSDNDMKSENANKFEGNSESLLTVESEPSKQERRKSQTMNVTHVACPQVNVYVMI